MAKIVRGMQSRSNPEFELRPSGLGISKIQSYQPNQVLLDFTISESENAIVHLKGIPVLLEDIQAQADGTYLARIKGFEPPSEIGPSGLRVGDAVGFREEHVFSASK